MKEIMLLVFTEVPLTLPYLVWGCLGRRLLELVQISEQNLGLDPRTPQTLKP